MLFQKFIITALILGLITANMVHSMAVKISDSEDMEVSDISKPKNRTSSEKISWLRRQISRLGGAAGEVGNAMGEAGFHATTTAEKICTLIKKIIPIMAAICRVGQFRFCATTGLSSPDESYQLSKTDLEKLD